ncbi:MAG: hypothetical protein JST50_13705 [Bacteroidetes bacterium]|jgi:hypothetical protein|nr:hypothetical protein [Bacteroidota bacterium]
MQLDRYQLKAEESLTVFEFTSNGPKGQIPKLIKFSETNLKDLYNLAFGDKDLTSGDLNDLAISNNGDSQKVLATVVSTVYAFSDKYPNSFIYATGSTKARTRLYRMGITKYLSEITKDFDLYGLRNDEWEVFEKGIEYEAFLAKRKNSNFML